MSSARPARRLSKGPSPLSGARALGRRSLGQDKPDRDLESQGKLPNVRQGDALSGLEPLIVPLDEAAIGHVLLCELPLKAKLPDLSAHGHAEAAQIGLHLASTLERPDRQNHDRFCRPSVEDELDFEAQAAGIWRGRDPRRRFDGASGCRLASAQSRKGPVILHSSLPAAKLPADPPRCPANELVLDAD